MIQTEKLAGLIVERGMSQTGVAKAIGMHPKTFYAKMHKGVFDSDEIQKMISLLSIEDPLAIFFAKQ